MLLKILMWNHMDTFLIRFVWIFPQYACECFLFRLNAYLFTFYFFKLRFNLSFILLYSLWCFILNSYNYLLWQKRKFLGVTNMFLNSFLLYKIIIVYQRNQLKRRPPTEFRSNITYMLQIINLPTFNFYLYVCYDLKMLHWCQQSHRFFLSYKKHNF